MADRDTFSILCVCTGDICRSPTAERLLYHQLRQLLPVDASRFAVGSAGTGALVGEPIQAHAATLLTRHGVDATGFQARQLTEELLGDADLILALTREHRFEAARLLPAIVPRLFTLCEFARLAAAASSQTDLGVDPVARARALVPAAVAQRGLVLPERPTDDDVGDPYGGPAAAYQRSFETIAAAVETIVTTIASPRRALPG